MCTWITERNEVEGSGKGPGTEWIALSHATVYFDHPQDAPFDHSLNIDFTNDALGPNARVAVELSAASARALVTSIEAALASAEFSPSQPEVARRAVSSDAGRQSRPTSR